MPPTIIVSGLIKPVGLRIRASDQQAIVLQRDGKLMDLAWLDSSEQRLLVADAAGSRVMLVEAAQPANPPVDIVPSLSHLWAAQPASGAQIVLGAADTLLTMAYTPVPADPVTAKVG